MTDQIDTWQWQEAGTAWKGRGIYHVTLTQSDRSQPLMGSLVIPHDDPEQAHVVPSDLGKMIITELQASRQHHPEIEIWAYQIMPDHLHAIVHVARRMPVGIKTVVRGFWQSAKRCYRDWREAMPDDIRNNRQYESLEQKSPLPANLYEHVPVVVPMSHRGHLPVMMTYVHENPCRLALRRLHPGYFRVTHGITIGGTTYDAVGNLLLLYQHPYQTVHVHKELVWLADGRSSSGCNARAQRDAEAAGYRGNPQPLRDYMNGCVLEARKGVVSVSPFISPHEQQIRDVLIREGHSIIYLLDNGYPRYYKPGDPWPQAVADGRVLILAPTTYDPKHVLLRAQCSILNQQAEAIVAALNSRSSIAPDDIRNNRQ